MTLRKTRLNTHEGGSGVNPPRPPNTIWLNWLGFLPTSLAAFLRGARGARARLCHRRDVGRRLRSPGGGCFHPFASGSRRSTRVAKATAPGRYLGAALFQLLIVVNAAAAGDLRVEGNKKPPGPERRLYIQVSRCSKTRKASGGGATGAFVNQKHPQSCSASSWFPTRAELISNASQQLIDELRRCRRRFWPD